MEFQPLEFNGICDKCKKAGEKACEYTNYKGIMLLSPEGIWICENCLTLLKNKIIIGADA